MRGTQRVGSLLRLFFGAAFLCLAWVLLSSTQAGAAERPAPVGLIASVADPVTESPADIASDSAPVLKDSVAVVARPAEPVVAPVVQQLRASTAKAVDAGATGLKTVAAAVPSLEAPVVAVADEVVALTDAVPLVGRDPQVGVPLPSQPAAPVAVPLPELDVLVPVASSDEPAKPVVPQQDSVPMVASGDGPRGLALAALDWNAQDIGTGSVAIAEWTLLVPGAPEPSELPDPWLSLQSPMPLTQSVPSPGGGTSSGDLASISPAFALPSPTMRGSHSSDWRVPTGLPNRPGSRPD